MMELKWQLRFMRLAKEISSWSKDPSSQIGAVIVNDDRRILATGYNGFPKPVADDMRLDDRETKYPLIIHAEMNALLNALNSGVPVKGGTLFVYNLPICSECAKNIAQSGISSVVMIYPNTDSKWYDQWVSKTRPLFEECGMKCYMIYENDL
jgi:dCMP deaminase